MDGWRNNNRSDQKIVSERTGRKKNSKGAGRVRFRKASDTRERLVASARGLFAEKRFEDVKVSDIVTGAGVSQGTFYYHFADKEAVLVHILEGFFAKGRALGEGWAQTRDTGAETIASFARAVATLIFDNQDIMRMISGESVGHERRVAKLIKDFYNDLYDQVTRAVELGIKLGVVRPCDARIAAVSHVGMIKEVIQDQLDNDHRGEVDLEHIVSELLQLIYHGVRPIAHEE